ncbi:hypothetical protein R70723_08115 [Paenibacillus sp. FSL R7-0273]|uniref:glycosyl hydrolase family 28 protein n=1 Tax=Paenibacillus sp. FSL R7-0273 TaxID=1536772 RepID=UPI0004F759DD|nr:glycoside hydrolase family 28 protein [Paenibacillus sp. FSL R7-0273]AIQ45845.1 hypothetical protein R70723_08115 [Paenibacillus sp. FSL R7-0273]OMF95377.1 hypothetical protein BK144_07630 [Paenibacillus sp. FSL R7-0273]
MQTKDNSLLTPLNLVSPPSARTDASIAVVWDKPELSGDIACYRVYVNDVIHGICTAADYTVTGLKPAQEYKVYVCAVTAAGEVSPGSNTVTVSTKPEGELFDITVFGAVEGGVVLNTAAIQAAIDACTPGGTVYVPAGTFLSGALFLKSCMTLFIEKGGVLLGSAQPAYYPLMTYRWEGREQLCYASLVNTPDCSGGERLEHITIAGGGTIDANGAALFKAEMAEKEGFRGRAVCLRSTDYVYLKDITVRQSPAWCVHLIYCNQVTANNVSLYTKNDEHGRRYADVFNGDGLNPDSSSNIYIFNSLIASQDDCIAIKSGRDEEGRRVGIPSENIRITNCRFKSGFGVAVGSEMSGGVRNVKVSDCTFEDVYSIGTVKAPRGRGAVIENIVYEDCTLRNYSLEHEDCRWFRGAINIDQFYGHKEYDPDRAEEVNEGTGIIRDITFRNIVLDTHAGNAVFMAGLPEQPLQNIVLENISAIGKYGLKAYNIEGMTINNVSVLSRLDEPYQFHNAK